jgi:hypothetical protein
MKSPSSFSLLSPLLPDDVLQFHLLRPELLTGFEYLSNIDLLLTFGCTVQVHQPSVQKVVYLFGFLPMLKPGEPEVQTVDTPTLQFLMKHQSFFTMDNMEVTDEAHFQLFKVFQHIENHYLSPIERARKTPLKGVRGAFPRRHLLLRELRGAA